MAAAVTRNKATSARISIPLGLDKSALIASTRNDAIRHAEPARTSEAAPRRSFGGGDRAALGPGSGINSTDGSPLDKSRKFGH
jgi:hypothetical protein